jgi:hypothetical protein
MDLFEVSQAGVNEVIKEQTERSCPPNICFIVQDELNFANFELTLSSGVHFLTLVAVHPCPVVFQGTAANCHRRGESIYWKLIDKLDVGNL